MGFMVSNSVYELLFTCQFISDGKPAGVLCFLPCGALKAHSYINTFYRAFPHYQHCLLTWECFNIPRGWHSTRASLTHFLTSSSLGQMQGFTVSPGNRTHKADHYSKFLYTDPVALKITPLLALILSISLCSLATFTSHFTFPPHFAGGDYPVTFLGCVPASHSFFQVEETVDPSVRRSLFPLLLLVSLFHCD